MRTVRNEDGGFLIETLMAALIGSILLLATYGELTGFYRQGSTNTNQILATNMAQQLVDNARNSTWAELTAIAGTGWQDVPLYTMPSYTNTTLFPRPLLRNPDLTYNAKSTNQTFNGNAKERLIAETNTAGDILRLQIEITWKDQKGSGHKYTEETVITKTGIHN
jgi:hypothetical protein